MRKAECGRGRQVRERERTEDNESEFLTPASAPSPGEVGAARWMDVGGADNPE